MNTIANTRRYDIDWLRIIAVLLLFPFHVARVFNYGDEFYAKSLTLSKGLTWIVVYLDHWHMPLFFVLAGASTWFALSRRNSAHYAGERVKRLLIPFLFGLVLLIPPQSYLGAVSHGNDPGSFFAWFPHFFHLNSADEGGYFLGGLTFGQLWFIFHLFIYSLVALPIFLFLRRGAGRKLVGLLARAATKPGVILLFAALAIPAIWVGDFAGGNPVWLGIPFILGYVLVSDARFERAIDRHKLVALILGPVALLAVTYFEVNGGLGLTGWAGTVYKIYSSVFVCWFTIIAVLGYGRRYLNRGGAFQKYAATASYPVYLLHQTAIAAVGVAVLKGGLGVPLSFALILLGSFVASVAAYEAMRRVNVFRFILGIKGTKRNPAPEAKPAEQARVSGKTAGQPAEGHA